MHANSNLSLRSINNDGSKQARIEMILECYSNGRAYSDRQILAMLYPESDDMNKVKPRITELLTYHYLKNTNPPIEEVGSVKCSITGKTVRLVRIKNFNAQTRMF